MKTKPYTVVLLRPDYMTDMYGQDVYVAHVNAPTTLHAVQTAQEQAFDADAKDDAHPDDPEDYALCVMFEGHLNTTLFGWQL